MLGQANIMAAANMDTEIVFPNRLGVLTCAPVSAAKACVEGHSTSISCGVLSQELISSSRLCARANAPGPSRLKKTRAQLFRYS